MSLTRRILLAGLAALPLSLPVSLSPALAETPASRIVSIGGGVTEIVFALGQQHRLVARDTTSTYPPEAELLPDVGYIRRLSPEGVLSVQPDLILTDEGAGPPETVELLENAGIPFREVPQGFDRAAILAKIHRVGEVLGVSAEAEALAEEVAADLDAAMAQAGAMDKRVLFIISMQGGRVMASGTGTAADGIINMVGAQNAVSEYPGYKTLTDEAITRAAPDVILMMSRNGEHTSTTEMLLANPAIATTPAGQAEAFVTMDGMYMLGFSVRTADAVRDLARALRDSGTALNQGG
ncbi:iron complex transport system substrate-binding protein [Pseudooceanicola antarcticus]|uniref:Hemin ABC transporter substrate-binding protein n=1 Tax=Pseudooceanicola antarcticus TaxID=1247613 RepID=A0A285IMY3_9RHOB|nr:ABC transporter substrate-binding protein [Pseudooceanicola antarcticus]PJE28766.1 hemin ABC transporter substrate-binding protein [Pseudooceanicola antarcticus]SNY48321.1 iron complex transport system substrate-binding protein [Pseudooceanicola antarcticus]